MVSINYQSMSQEMSVKFFSTTENTHIQEVSDLIVKRKVTYKELQVDCQQKPSHTAEP